MRISCRQLLTSCLAILALGAISKPASCTPIASQEILSGLRDGIPQEIIVEVQWRDVVGGLGSSDYRDPLIWAGLLEFLETTFSARKSALNCDAMAGCVILRDFEYLASMFVRIDSEDALSALLSSETISRVFLNQPYYYFQVQDPTTIALAPVDLPLDGIEGGATATIVSPGLSISTISSVPEPSTGLLLGVGLAGLGWGRRQRHR